VPVSGGCAKSAFFRASLRKRAAGSKQCHEANHQCLKMQHRFLKRFCRTWANDCPRDTATDIALAAESGLDTSSRCIDMFSHIVIFWTDPAQPNAADEVVAGANRLLPSIPGVTTFHVGKMAPSPRPVVEQSYQVALNIIFPDREAHDNYQVHPQHTEFVAQYVKPLVKKVLVYDFE
jgi:hypothetical protein